MISFGNPLKEALDILEESAFTKIELAAYDKYRDAIISEQTLIEESTRKAEKLGMERGMEKGLRMGIEQGIKQGIEKGMEQDMEMGIEKGRKRRSRWRGT